MSRTLPTGLATNLATATIAPVFLVQLEWPSGTVLAWNGYSVLNWDGRDWQPLGNLGGIKDITETADGTANGVQLSLSGIPSAAIAQALDNAAQGRLARIYFGVISAGGFAIDPYLVFDGLIDYTNIVMDGDTSTITVFLEKELIDNRSDARRCTHEDQQIDYPGDLGFEFVAPLSNKNFTWGRVTVAPSTPGGGTGNGDDTNSVLE